jgi:hypothetical protein
MRAVELTLAVPRIPLSRSLERIEKRRERRGW